MTTTTAVDPIGAVAAAGRAQHRQAVLNERLAAAHTLLQAGDAHAGEVVAVLADLVARLAWLDAGQPAAVAR